MNDTFIYIGDDLVDLYPDTIIAYSYQNTLVNSLKTRRVSFTNKLKAPPTENNAIIFGFAIDEKIKQRFVRLQARIVQSGIELVSRGYCFVTSASGNYEIEIYNGLIDFVETLGDETIDELYEIDTTRLTWSASTIDSKRAATSGIVAPALSYGQLQEKKQIPPFSEWEQLNSFGSDNWSFSSGQISAELEFGGSEDRANMYAVRYKTFKGVTYTVTTTIDSQGGILPYRLRLYVLKEADVIDGVVSLSKLDTPADEIDPTSFGTPPQVVSFTFTPNADYEYLGIDTYTIVDDADIVVEDLTVSIDIHIGDIYFPSIYYASILENLITSAGYEFDSISFDKLDKLIIPYSKSSFRYTGLFNNCREFIARLSSPQSVTVTDTAILFDTITKKDLFGYYDPTTGTFSQNNDYQFVIDPATEVRSFYSKFYLTLRVRAVGNVEIQILSQGDGELASASVTDGTFNITLSVNNYAGNSKGYNFDGGDTVYINVVLTGGATAEILSGEFSNNVDGECQEETDPQFYPAEILPPIKKKDFFSDFCVRFGIIPKEKNKKLYFRTFNQVIQDKASALDWTDKRDTSRPDDIAYGNDYAQNNYFDYRNNDQYFTNKYGGGNIAIDNTTLDKESTLYTSIFTGSTDLEVAVPNDTLYVGYIPYLTDEITEYTGLSLSDNYRLMIVRDKLSAEIPVFYNGNSRTDYKVANFLMPGEGYIAWQSFLDKNYSSLINALQQNKVIVRYYNLTTLDITEVDPHKLIYDNGSYFLINKISNFIPGKLTKVELFKVQ